VHSLEGALDVLGAPDVLGSFEILGFIDGSFDGEKLVDGETVLDGPLDGEILATFDGAELFVGLNEVGFLGPFPFGILVSFTPPFGLLVPLAFGLLVPLAFGLLVPSNVGTVVPSNLGSFDCSCFVGSARSD